MITFPVESETSFSLNSDFGARDRVNGCTMGESPIDPGGEGAFTYLDSSDAGGASFTTRPSDAGGFCRHDHGTVIPMVAGMGNPVSKDPGRFSIQWG